MNYLLEFLHQEVPKSGKAMPAYYRKALVVSEVLLAVYSLVSAALIGLTTGKWELFSAVVFFATVTCLLNIDRMTARLNLAFFSLIIAGWVVWYVYMFGWSSGSQHILLPILSLSFFNIYVKPTEKIVYFIGLIALRVTLFEFSLHHFSITITIGVEENDFQSSMEELFNQADRKLYMDKANGRDQVVI